MNRIFKYTGRIKTDLGCQTKPEAWLHIALVFDKTDSRANFPARYVIYVWDTRQIIEEGDCSIPKDMWLKQQIAAVDNHEPLVGKQADSFNKSLRFGSTNGIQWNLQIDKKTGYGTEYTKYSINGVTVCITYKGRDMYCRIVNGRPSNLRDVSKTANSTDWYIHGLAKALNVRIDYKHAKQYCIEFHPDTTWGYTGKAISKTAVQEAINNVIANCLLD